MLSQTQIAQAWAPPCSNRLATMSLHGRGRVTVRSNAIEATKALNACLVSWNYQTRYHDTGAFVCRRKASGSGQWSNHSYGTAIDVNWLLNPYGGSKHHIPAALAAAICRIRTNNGRQVWNWGGYWRGTRDWMHFELVCRPQDLATGINWSTVNGRPVGHIPKPPPAPKPPAPKPQPIQEDEDDMGSIIRLTDTGEIFHVYAENYRHLRSIKAVNDRINLAAFAGKKLPQQGMHSWQFAAFVMQYDLIKDRDAK